MYRFFHLSQSDTIYEAYDVILKFINDNKSLFTQNIPNSQYSYVDRWEQAKYIYKNAGFIFDDTKGNWGRLSLTVHLMNKICETLPVVKLYLKECRQSDPDTIGSYELVNNAFKKYNIIIDFLVEKSGMIQVNAPEIKARIGIINEAGRI